MKSLKEILNEEIDYWFDVKARTKNKLLLRVANSNIIKRKTQIRKLKLGIKVS